MTTNVMQITWTPGVTLDTIEEQVIRKAYAYYQKNKTQTAAALGIAIRTLENKMERYDEQDKNLEQYIADEQKRREKLVEDMRGQKLMQQFPRHFPPLPQFEQGETDQISPFLPKEGLIEEHVPGSQVPSESSSMPLQVTTFRAPPKKSSSASK